MLQVINTFNIIRSQKSERALLPNMLAQQGIG